tara:strand:+ start:218 stop:397 length:180 start_codon:yes stop_codon:yes gene_type:complete
MTLTVSRTGILSENNKKVLVQIGKNFYELRLAIQTSGNVVELKKIIDSGKYSLQLLKEE